MVEIYVTYSLASGLPYSGMVSEEQYHLAIH